VFSFILASIERVTETRGSRKKVEKKKKMGNERAEHTKYRWNKDAAVLGFRETRAYVGGDMQERRREVG